MDINPYFRVTIESTPHTRRGGFDLVFKTNESQSFAKSDLTPNELLETADRILDFLLRNAVEENRMWKNSHDRLQRKRTALRNAISAYISVAPQAPSEKDANG